MRKRAYIAKIPLHPYNSVLFLYTSTESYVKKRNIDLEYASQCDGITEHDDDCNEFHVLLRETDINTIAHEAMHVTAELLLNRGIALNRENVEPYAYLVGYITESIRAKCAKQKEV
jgi:hypothetical protein